MDTQHAQIRALAAQVKFVQKVRTINTEANGYTTLADNAPEWAQPMCFAAHQDGSQGGMLPDDWRYQFISDAIDCITETTCEEDAQECMANGVSIYTSDLMDWLGSHNGRQGYCDDALKEYGAVESTDQLIRMGQAMERDEVFSAVYRFLLDMVEETDKSDESVTSKEA